MPWRSAAVPSAVRFIVLNSDISHAPTRPMLEIGREALADVVVVGRLQSGCTQATTALEAAGAAQLFNIKGDFSAGSHTVAVDFRNDA